MKSAVITRIAVGIVLASTGSLHAQLNTVYGNGAFPNSTSYPYADSSAFGFQALFNNTTGQNSAFGWSALSANTTGTGNVAMGGVALANNVGGSYNTAIGYSTLIDNLGSYNTAVGSWALNTSSSANYNTATGYKALYADVSGYGNVANGYAALQSNQGGTGNTALGMEALLSATGTENTALGYYAGGNVLNGSYNIHIGNYGVSGDYGTIKIGSQGTQTSTYIAGIYGTNTTGVPVYINSNGQLGTTASSRRFKDHITDMGDTSGNLFQLRPVNFFYKPEYDDGSHLLQYGLIAEEVEKVYPEMVAYDPAGQIMTVKYQMLTPMLLNEAQKQKIEIQAQTEQIRSLEQRLTALEALLSGQTPSGNK